MSLGAPHRDAPLATRCDRCDAVATARCLRCARPACPQHAPARYRRCEPCEAELDRRLAGRERPESPGQRPVNPAAVGVAKKSALVASLAGMLVTLLSAAVGQVGWAAAILLALTLPLLIIGWAVVGLMFYTLAEQASITSGLDKAVARLRFLRERPGRRLRSKPAPLELPATSEEE